MDIEGVIVGYDPGGNNAHGLCLIRYSKGVILNVQVSTHPTAKSIIDELTKINDVIAIGVDTLTCWSTGASGWRPADRWLKKEYKEITHSIASANSLFGAMGLNGMSVLLSLKERYPEILISEAHPKVLYYELFKKKYDYKQNHQNMDYLLSNILTFSVSTANDHEWDSVISALTVAKGMNGEWVNNLHLLPINDNESIITPCGKTYYWWPK